MFSKGRKIGRDARTGQFISVKEARRKKIPLSFKLLKRAKDLSLARGQTNTLKNPIERDKPNRQITGSYFAPVE